MRFYQQASDNIGSLIQRCYFEADQTRVSLALNRLRWLEEQFSKDARIPYAEGGIRRDFLGQGLRARDLFEHAYLRACECELDGDYCWSAACNAADLARDASEFRKWVELTATAPPVVQGRRPTFRERLEALDRGALLQDIHQENAETERLAGKNGPSAAHMEVQLAAGGMDEMDEAHVRRFRAQRIRILDQQCDEVRIAMFERFAPEERLALQEALAELNRALVLDPYDAELWNLSAAWNNLLENFTEALAVADRAASLRTPYPKAHINAAWALYRSGDYSEAKIRIDLAAIQAQETQDQPDIEQSQRLAMDYSQRPREPQLEELIPGLETFSRAARRCSELELERDPSNVSLEDMVSRLIHHAKRTRGDLALGLVPMIAELLSDFTPETVCRVVVTAKQRIPQLMEDSVYATLYLISKCEGVERRDASRLLALILFIPLDAKRIRSNYRELILATEASRSRLLSNLDRTMRDELRRIVPRLDALIADQTEVSGRK
jgi:tetratricopeptide (TPR) repeat protein